MTHYHVAMQPVVAGARIGYIPDEDPQRYSSWEGAGAAASAAAEELATALRVKGHQVELRTEGRNVIVEWEDGYSKGRIFEPVECSSWR